MKPTKKKAKKSVVSVRKKKATSRKAVVKKVPANASEEETPADPWMVSPLDDVIHRLLEINNRQSSIINPSVRSSIINRSRFPSSFNLHPFPLADRLARPGHDAEALSQSLLSRLVALNHERAAEEKSGHIRWLRPDYQCTTGVPLAPGPDTSKIQNHQSSIPLPRQLSTSRPLLPIHPSSLNLNPLLRSGRRPFRSKSSPSATSSPPTDPTPPPSPLSSDARAPGAKSKSGPSWRRWRRWGRCELRRNSTTECTEYTDK